MELEKEKTVNYIIETTLPALESFTRFEQANLMGLIRAASRLAFNEGYQAGIQKSIEIVKGNRNVS